ncbi:MAG TPA: dUTP diphosphatase [Kofleriaceae bacterium]|jgi:dUTP pyrophosphatase|nr:dUTP diphosphatase [Kofleriaceae bacterium]
MECVTTPRVQIRRLRPDAMLPRYQTADAAGMDLHAALDAPMQVAPGAVVAVPTGVAMAIPRGFEGQVRPRSGLAAKHAVTVVNAPGTIDSDYSGEVKVLLINHGREPFVIEPGHRIAQLVVAPVSQAELVEVDELPTTERGAGGFGSTGR